MLFLNSTDLLQLDEIDKFVATFRQVATSLLTPYNRLVTNQPISEYVRMACDSFLTTCLLQIVDKLVAR